LELDLSTLTSLKNLARLDLSRAIFIQSVTQT
jgi:hypothetical protein